MIDGFPDEFLKDIASLGWEVDAGLRKRLPLLYPVWQVGRQREREACAAIADEYRYPPDDVAKMAGRGDEAGDGGSMTKNSAYVVGKYVWLYTWQYSGPGTAKTIHSGRIVSRGKGGCFVLARQPYGLMWVPQEQVFLSLSSCAAKVLALMKPEEFIFGPNGATMIAQEVRAMCEVKA